MNYVEDFQAFFDGIIAENTSNEKHKLRVIVSQIEEGELCLFIVSADKNCKGFCHGHYGICNLKDEKSMSISEYFGILNFLKTRHGLDATFELDWFLK